MIPSFAINRVCSHVHIRGRMWEDDTACCSEQKCADHKNQDSVRFNVRTVYNKIATPIFVMNSSGKVSGREALVLSFLVIEVLQAK